MFDTECIVMFMFITTSTSASAFPLQSKWTWIPGIKKYYDLLFRNQLGKEYSLFILELGQIVRLFSVTHLHKNITNLLDSLLGTLPSLGMLKIGVDNTLGLDTIVVML